MACPYDSSKTTAFWGTQGQQFGVPQTQYESFEIEGLEMPQTRPIRTRWGSRSEVFYEPAPSLPVPAAIAAATTAAPAPQTEAEVAAQLDARTGCTQAVRAMCTRNECSTVGDVQSKLRCAACGPCVVPGPPTCTPSMIKYCSKMACATATDMRRGVCRGCEPCAAPEAVAVAK